MVAGNGGDEDVAPERVELHVGLGRHRRRPRHVLQERDLTEVVAGPELRHPASLLGDDDGALLDRVEAVTFVAFADDHFARSGRDGFERAGEPLEDRLGQRREDRDLAHQLEPGRRQRGDVDAA